MFKTRKSRLWLLWLLVGGFFTSLTAGLAFLPDKAHNSWWHQFSYFWIFLICAAAGIALLILIIGGLLKLADWIEDGK